MDWIDFREKVVLVTGASRGIGAGIIRAFSDAGAACVLNYVGDPKGQNVADAQSVASSLADPLLVECDVSNPARVGEMVATVVRERGGLDILINNAGILRDRTIAKMSSEEWQSVLDVNLGGAFNCLKASAAVMRDGGRIVNIASLSATVGFFGQANYAASKAGIMALTRVAARELARRRINVNAIAPGVIDTEMGRSIPPDRLKALIEQVPAGRLGSVQDVVDAILFLCSQRADYITGQILHVNGGFFMGG